MTKMKDSGIKWIGQIPEDWNIIRGKNVMHLLNRLVHEDDDVITCFRDGEVTLRKNRRELGYTMSDKEIGYQGINTGDLVVHGMDGFAGAIGISDSRGKGSPVLIVLDSENNKKYLMYYLRCAAMKGVFEMMATGIRVRSCDLRWNKLAILPCLIPDRNQQDRIVECIDNSRSKIDTLSADIQEQIRILEDYRKSVISEAVTKGLDKSVPMKDSGIEWIGEIPEDWDVVRGKNAMHPLDRPVHDTDDVITCFRDGEVTLRKNRREEGFTMSDKEIGYQGINVGDLVVHGMDGFAGSIGISDSRGKGSPVLIVLGSDNNRRYLMYYLRYAAFKGVFEMMATGIRVRSCDLRWNKLAILPILIPERNEQDRIVDYIDNQLAKTDDMIAIKQNQLDVLGKYKQSIIYEYVTGKKQVKEI